MGGNCDQGKENIAIKEDTMEERIQKVLRSVFASHEGDFDVFFGPTEIAGWDSLNHLNLVMALQDEFNIQLDFEEMLEIKAVGDIHSIITRKMK